jgi:hypothetical protein
LPSHADGVESAGAAITRSDGSFTLVGVTLDNTSCA